MMNNEQMNLQPIYGIGCLGSVSDGKSTMAKALSGKETPTHSKERVRNITINQGFANTKIFKKLDSDEYITTDSTVYDMDGYKLVHHFSLVDCPGHQEYIKTMLASLELMKKGAVVVVAVDQELSMKPQLIQHLAAAKLANIAKIIICMNKIDLVSKEVLMKRKKELDSMLAKYDIVPCAIIPTCFNKKIGLDCLVRTIMKEFNPSDHFKQVESEKPIFNISRTFDINKPGTKLSDINGGVVGGTVFFGKFKIGDTVEIRPGYIYKQGAETKHIPLKTIIKTIKTETVNLSEAYSGGLVGLGTDLDPYYCKNNHLAGMVVGLPDFMPPVYTEMNVNVSTITTFGYNWVPALKDTVVLKIGTITCDAMITNLSKDCLSGNVRFKLAKPICASNKDIIICKMYDKILRIVGTGIIME